ncbi:DNA primase catalytic core domain protein [Sulfobacillus acidophilus TPY]|nr:DNA primase catalytic core domain protein [Sulfobacillus acidophilus TPY]
MPQDHPTLNDLETQVAQWLINRDQFEAWLRDIETRLQRDLSDFVQDKTIPTVIAVLALDAPGLFALWDQAMQRWKKAMQWPSESWRRWHQGIRQRIHALEADRAAAQRHQQAEAERQAQDTALQQFWENGPLIIKQQGLDQYMQQVCDLVTRWGRAIWDHDRMRGALIVARAQWPDHPGWSAVDRAFKRHKNWTETDQRTWLDAAKRYRAERDKSSGDVIPIRPGVVPTSPPSLTVGQVWPTAPDPDLLLPDKYLYAPDGVHVGHEDDDPEFILGPAYVWMWYEDVVTHDHWIRIRYWTNGRWADLLTSPSQLLDPQTVATFADKGLFIRNPKKAGSYLNDTFNALKTQMGHAAHSLSTMGFTTLPDGRTILVLPNTPARGGDPQDPPITTLVDPSVRFVHAVRPDFSASDAGATVARTVFHHLWALAPASVLIPVLGWFWASLWADRIRDTTGTRQFPILSVFAARGTGKTTLLTMIYRALWGDGEVHSASMTPFALIKNLAATYTMPLFLDEFRPGEMAEGQERKFYQLLRQNFNGQSEQRGTASQKIQTYPLIAPVILAGESRPTDSAVLDRSVLVTLTHDMTHRPEARPALQYLHTHADQMRQAAGWILDQRLTQSSAYDAETLRAEFEAYEKYLWELVHAHQFLLPDRAVWSLAVALWGFVWGKALGLVPEDIVLDEAIALDLLRQAELQRRAEEPVDHFVRFVEELWGLQGRSPAGDIPLGVKPGAEIRLPRTLMESAWDLWCRDHKLPRLGRDNLLQELRKIPGLLIADNQVVWIQDKTYRCYVLSIPVLHNRYGLPPEVWGLD